MSKKGNEKQRKYTRKEIRESRKKDETELIHGLVRRLLNNDLTLTIAEADAASMLVKNLRSADNGEKMNIAAVPGAQDFIFVSLYQSYHGDLEGQFGIEKFDYELVKRARHLGVMTSVATIEEKQEDVIRLNEYYKKWEKKYDSDRHKDQILNLTIIETRKDLKRNDEDLKAKRITDIDHQYGRKAIVLRGKYLYLRVTSMFQDLGVPEIIVDLNGNKVEINAWSMIHILNRHYAKGALPFDSEKSFHSDQTLNLFEDPQIIKTILENIASNAKGSFNDLNFIPLRYNGLLYAIYTQLESKNVGKEVRKYRRLQTFYPAEAKKDLDKITNEYHEVVIDSQFSGFIRK